MNDKEINLRRIAEYLKRLPLCHACVVEGQQHDCMCIESRFMGREILRTLDRDGWETRFLIPEDKEEKP